jgi:hypothetical protein
VTHHLRVGEVGLLLELVQRGPQPGADKAEERVDSGSRSALGNGWPYRRCDVGEKARTFVDEARDRRFGKHRAAEEFRVPAGKFESDPGAAARADHDGSHAERSDQRRRVFGVGLHALGCLSSRTAAVSPSVIADAVEPGGPLSVKVELDTP